MNIQVIDNSNFREDILEYPPLKIGEKIFWVYNEDREYWEQLNKEGCDEAWEEWKSQCCNCGIILSREGWEYRGGEIHADDAIICVYDYQVEKCYPTVDYITFSTISSDAEVYEVFGE